MKLVVCGDSFMSADVHRPETHFSELLENHGHSVINLARGGMSNTGIGMHQTQNGSDAANTSDALNTPSRTPSQQPQNPDIYVISNKTPNTRTLRSKRKKPIPSEHNKPIHE